MGPRSRIMSSPLMFCPGECAVLVGIERTDPGCAPPHHRDRLSSRRSIGGRKVQDVRQPVPFHEWAMFCSDMPTTAIFPPCFDDRQGRERGYRSRPAIVGTFPEHGTLSRRGSASSRSRGCRRFYLAKEVSGLDCGRYCISVPFHRLILPQIGDAPYWGDILLMV